MAHAMPVAVDARLANMVQASLGLALAVSDLCQLV